MCFFTEIKSFFQKTLAKSKIMCYNNTCCFIYSALQTLGGVKMAKCAVCGKGVTFGIKVSHSHRRSNRAWKPNVRKVKALVNGNVQTISVCTRCLRSNKVQRAV